MTNNKKQVVIIGGGITGICAAIEAFRNNCDVVLLEKSNRLGGNISSIDAVSVLNEHLEKSLENTSNKESISKLQESLITASLDVVSYLKEIGVDLTYSHQIHTFSGSIARTADEDKCKSIGNCILSALLKQMEKIKSFQLRVIMEANVTHLLRGKDNSVVGVCYSVPVKKTNQESIVYLFADSIVLSTGGYRANQSMLMRLGAPPLVASLSHSISDASGEGIQVAQQTGAQLIDTQKVQIHPTAIVNPRDPFALQKQVLPETLISFGAILVNNKGERFVNEMESMKVVSDAILANGFILPSTNDVPKDGKQCDTSMKVAYMIINRKVIDMFGVNSFKQIEDLNVVESFSDASQLCEKMNIDRSKFQSTISMDSLNRKNFIPFTENEQLYVIMVTPCVHATLGGIKVTEKMEVLDTSDSIIKGLYAAGSIIGGIYHENRLPRDEILQDIVFGRIAGAQAGSFVGSRTVLGVTRIPDFTDYDGTTHDAALHPQEFVPLKLREKFQMNKTNFLFRFDLPSPSNHAGLLAGQYITVRKVFNGEEVIRYYSPVSKNSDFGKIELLVKIELDKMKDTSMTNYFHTMQPGDTLEFKGPLGGFKYHRNAYRAIGLVAGGTGISPMMQIIRSITSHPEDNTKVTLLYGNFFEDDILCKEELMYLSSTRDNITAWITLNNPPPHWQMGSGFISEQMMIDHLPKPADDIKIVLCGPPPMIKAMIPILKKVGYTDDMIFSYI